MYILTGASTLSFSNKSQVEFVKKIKVIFAQFDTIKVFAASALLDLVKPQALCLVHTAVQWT